MIYTKKGDRGTTSLFEPNPKKRGKVSKASPAIEAIGAVDEANSYIGIANLHTKNKRTKRIIKTIQRNLFEIGAILAKSPLKFDDQNTLNLETEIDRLDSELPPLRNFLLPDGGEVAVHFMYARALVRRAERATVALSKKEKVHKNILKYLNRLSDYLFMIFRDENRLARMKEEIWVGKK